MRGFFSRVTGALARVGDIDPVVHLGDPDDTSEPAAPLAAEDTAAIVTHLDVPPARPPWDAPLDRSCIDELPGRRCDGADALTSWITALKALEKRVDGLEARVEQIKEQQS